MKYKLVQMRSDVRDIPIETSRNTSWAVHSMGISMWQRIWNRQDTWLGNGGIHNIVRQATAHAVVAVLDP